MLDLLFVPAADPGFLDMLTGFLPVLIGALAILVSLLIFVSQRYKRCPSNKILVIYGSVGKGRSATTVHGGGKFVWPIIQDFDYLSLEPMQIEVPLKDALSSENIRVNVPSVFTVAIGTQPEIMQNAAIRLLGLNTAQVKKQAEDIIFGQLRQVIASMGIEDINRDRDTFLHSIQHSLEPELQKIGLVLINVNITDITDESGYIEAIGKRAAAEAVQNARADVADQEKLGEIRVTGADRDKMIQVANANKAKQIGIREAEREQAVRIADLNREQQVAEQRAVYAQETEVADAEREKRVSVAGANATAFEGEAQAEAKVAEAKSRLQVAQAEAYQIGETKKREAQAAVEEAQNRAMAKAALAEAERVEAERRAELESAGESPESEDDRGSRSRRRQKEVGRRGRSRHDLRQAGSRGPRAI